MELSPRQAAEAANSTYALRLSADMLDAAIGAPAIRDAFDIMGGTRLGGTSGMGPVSKNTGFGYVARGTGTRSGEVLIAIRGTEKTSAHDWMTNLRISGTTGPSGHIVHAGFMALASGILSQVNAILGNSNPSVIHVAGHSLGGATATLLAEAMNLRTGHKNVKLYTFGAPRAGVGLHASHLTDALGRSNIYRVYHHSDPVPMIPVFPYSHVPFEQPAYLMRGPGTLVSVAAHAMDPAYYKSVGSGNWSGLGVIRDPMLQSSDAAQEWLGQSANLGGSMLSASLLRMIMSALGWILRQAGKVAGVAVMGAATIVDYIAQLLYSGVLASLEIGTMVGQLMAAIMRFTGRTLAKGAKMTVAFFQYVLGLLFRTVATIAIRAIGALPG